MTNEEKIMEMLAQVQGDLAEVKEVQARMQVKQDQMGDDLHRVKAYLELDVEKRLEAINEGVDAIQEKMVPEDRVEKLEDDVVVLKTAFKMLAQDVAELKKAQ